ncbi:MAG: lipopolysaccharide biosynthesis protein [Chryseobacterium jejuense]|uniref:lipopolysaccharide biosynthesis protein n=1 Tax=Chryseobacterium jejuense TaxID=445960 RepID=UPI003D0AD2D0
MSRSKNSLFNIIFSVFFYLIILILTFFYRKSFVSNLNNEILGLNTTLTNLLSFLNLAELGVGAAVTYFLYQPLHEKNKDKIKEIIEILKGIYSKIGLAVLLVGVVISFFLKLIFTDVDIPDWIIYSTYFVLLFSSLFSYFFNYKQILLLADQRNYINIFIFQGSRAVKVLLQIFVLKFGITGYLYWVILEALYPVFSTILLNYFVQRSYKDVLTNTSFKNSEDSKILSEKIYSKTKQLFFHKLAGFILIQGSPLIIYFYTDLNAVAIYGNYLVIITGITTVVTMVFSSITPSVGHFLISNEKENNYKLYRELQIVELLLVSCICLGYFALVNHFMTFWMGDKYLFPESTILLMAIFIFLSLVRINDTFLTANGLFSDIYAPIIELIINFVCSVIFGYFWGINGVLFAINLSLFTVVFCWKPIFLNYKYFNKSLVQYFVTIFVSTFLLILLYFISKIAVSKFLNVDILIENIIIVFTTIVTYIMILFYFNLTFRSLVKRIKSYVFVFVNKKVLK